MKQFAVLGLGRFGHRVAAELASEGHEVLAVDRDERLVAAIRDRTALAVSADITDEDAMREIGLGEVEAAVVAIGEDQLVSIMATAVLRRVGVSRIVARATSPMQARILRLVGANEVVFPEDEIGIQVARRLSTPGYSELIRMGSGNEIVEIGALPDWIGLTIGEIGFRAKLGVAVIGIKRMRFAVAETGESETVEDFSDLPKADDRIESGDVLVLLAPSDRIAALRKGA